MASKIINVQILWCLPQSQIWVDHTKEVVMLAICHLTREPIHEWRTLELPKKEKKRRHDSVLYPMPIVGGRIRKIQLLSPK